MDVEKKIEKAILVIADHEKRIKNLEKKLSENQTIKKAPGKKSSKKGINDLILDLKSEGFFNKPQSREDIVKKLSQDGFRHKADSLNQPLQNLLRQKELARRGEPRKWKYVKR